MRPVLDTRLRNREPEPGLLNLPIPLPSVPVLSPIITPLVAGKNQQTPPHTAAPQPAPAPAPAPAPSQQHPKPPPILTPPAIIPPIGGSPGGGGGGGGGGSPPNSGGQPGNGGNGGGQGNTTPPSSGNGGGSNSPSGAGDRSNIGGSNPQGGSQSNPPLDSSPSPPPSGTSPGSGSLSVSGGTTFESTPTGVVALPINNDGRPDLAGGTISSQMQSGLGQSSTIASPSAASITPAGMGPSGAVSVGPSGSSSAGKSDNGNGGGSGSPSSNNASSSASHHLSTGAVGGIVALVVIASALLLFFIIRRRYGRRRAERRVEWINGYVSGDPDMQQVQRHNSMRSSWGTPVEHRFSDPFRWSMADGRSRSPEETDRSIEGVYAYSPDDGAPVLPMPVHSPTVYSPEDPFADAASQRQPIKPMSSLPLRFSLLSTGSGNRDPFDDANGYKGDEHASDSGISSATFGHRADANPGTGTEANFPLPPTTAGSTSTVYAIGSPSDLLQPPGILISFPDSPVSPTFAASGTSSYPRRASVKQPFQPSHERRDEVPLDKGDMVSVVSVYEDGWAFVQNESSNARGLAPLNCLEIDNP